MAGITKPSTSGIMHHDVLLQQYLDGRQLQGYPYKLVGVSTKDNKITSNQDVIVDTNGYHWVYEGVINQAGLDVPANTLPLDNILAKYQGWRCVGLLAGYAESDVKNYGAKCDGKADDYTAVQMALYHSKTAIYIYGECKIKQSVLIKPIGISILGVSGYVGAQLGNTLPASTLTFDGPYGKDAWAISSGEDASVEDPSRIAYMYIRAIGDSRDNLSCIKLTKSGYACDNGILNFWTGIKHDGGAAYVQIHRNNINSCNCCLDLSGSESHITDNHGYNDSLRSSAQFRPAVLLRGSAFIFQGNKFFGDGSNTPHGMIIWGFGNIVTDNIFDAFTDAGIIIECNHASIVPSNNIIHGNNISGIGVESDSANKFRAGIVLNNAGQGAGNLSGNVITGNTFFNKRGDRQMKYGILLNAISGSVTDARTIKDTLIANNTFGEGISDRKVMALGANHTGTRVRDNAGFVTENIGTGTYSHGDTIQHGMARPPEFIEFTLIDSGVPVSISYDTVTDTSFRIYIRDGSSGISGTRNIAWKATRLSV